MGVPALLPLINKSMISSRCIKKSLKTPIGLLIGVCLICLIILSQCSIHFLNVETTLPQNHEIKPQLDIINEPMNNTGPLGHNQTTSSIGNSNNLMTAQIIKQENITTTTSKANEAALDNYLTADIGNRSSYESMYDTLTDNASYIIQTDDNGTYSAFNVASGKSTFSSTDFNQVVKTTFSSLTNERTWKEKVVFIGNFTSGTFNIPSYTTVAIQGTIVTKAPIGIIGNHIELTGGTIQNIDPVNSTVISVKGSGDSLLASTHLMDIFIHNIQIIGNRQLATGNNVESIGMNGIDFSYVDNSTVNSCAVLNCSENGLFIRDYSSNIEISNNYFAYNGNGTVILNGLGQGVSVNYFCKNIKIIDNAFRYNYQNQIRVCAANDTIITGNLVTDSASLAEGFDTARNGGIYVLCSRNTLIDNNVVKDNRILGIWVDDISWDAAFNLIGSSNTISNNIVVNNSGSGIAAAFGMYNGTIINNIVQNCGYAPAPDQGAALNFWGAINCSIINNHFICGNTSSYNVILKNSSYNSFSGNLIRGSSTFGVELFGTPSNHLVGNNFINNNIEITTSYGMALLYVDNMTIKGNNINYEISSFPIAIYNLGTNATNLFILNNNLQGKYSPYISGTEYTVNSLFSNNTGFITHEEISVTNVKNGTLVSTSLANMYTTYSFVFSNTLERINSSYYVLPVEMQRYDSNRVLLIVCATNAGKIIPVESSDNINGILIIEYKPGYIQ